MKKSGVHINLTRGGVFLRGEKREELKLNNVMYEGGVDTPLRPVYASNYAERNIQKEGDTRLLITLVPKVI